MINISFILCKNQKSESDAGESAFYSFFSRILKCLRREEPQEWLECIEIYENLNIFLITLPYTVNELNSFSESKLEKIKELLENLIAGRGIENVIIPGKLKSFSWLKAFENRTFTGRHLYKSLLINILNELYDNRGIRLGDLDIAIVHGNDSSMLGDFMRLLSSRVKYVTVIAENKEEIEQIANSICYDTGLSFGLTKNYRSGMKNSDIIINLGNLKEFVVNSRINSKAIILNYGELDFGRIFCENIIINGIEVALPADLQKLLPVRIKECFNELELAEIVLEHWIGVESCNSTSHAAEEEMEFISRRFKEEGYKIVGFMGRRGILKTKDIIIYSNKDIIEQKSDRI